MANGKSVHFADSPPSPEEPPSPESPPRSKRGKRASKTDLATHYYFKQHVTPAKGEVREGSTPQDVINWAESTTTADNILQYGSMGVFLGGGGAGVSNKGVPKGYTRLGGTPEPGGGVRVVNPFPETLGALPESGVEYIEMQPIAPPGGDGATEVVYTPDGVGTGRSADTVGAGHKAPPIEPDTGDVSVTNIEPTSSVPGTSVNEHPIPIGGDMPDIPIIEVTIEPLPRPDMESHRVASTIAAHRVGNPAVVYGPEVIGGLDSIIVDGTPMQTVHPSLSETPLLDLSTFDEIELNVMSGDTFNTSVQEPGYKTSTPLGTSLKSALRSAMRRIGHTVKRVPSAPLDLEELPLVDLDADEEEWSWARWNPAFNLDETIIVEEGAPHPPGLDPDTVAIHRGTTTGGPNMLAKIVRIGERLGMSTRQSQLLMKYPIEMELTPIPSEQGPDIAVIYSEGSSILAEAGNIGNISISSTGPADVAFIETIGAASDPAYGPHMPRQWLEFAGRRTNLPPDHPLSYELYRTWRTPWYRSQLGVDSRGARAADWWNALRNHRDSVFNLIPRASTFFGDYNIGAISHYSPYHPDMPGNDTYDNSSGTSGYRNEDMYTPPDPDLTMPKKRKRRKKNYDSF